MNTDLLKDVLNEGDYAEFRERLGREIAKEAARKRRIRGAAWMAMAASLALLFALTLQRPRQLAQPISKPTIVIRTMALKNDQILRTRPIQDTSFTIHSADAVPKMNDAELLEIFANHPTALVAVNGVKKFLFLETADAKQFMGSN